MVKDKRAKKENSKKRTYKRKNKKCEPLKILLFFLVFLIISIASLIYLKEKLNDEVKFSKKTALLNEKIEEIDKIIDLALSNRGISSNDFKLSTIKKSDGEFKWDYKEGRAEVENLNSEKFSKELEKLSKIKNVSLSVEKKSNQLKAEVLVFGYKTHKFNFVSKNKNAASKELAKGVKQKNVKKQKIESNTVKQSSKPDKITKPKIIIIVDDVGLKKEAIDRLSKIDFPINFAILPFLPYSEYAASSAHKNGKEVLLHLPMEPKNSSGYSAEDAGEGALLVGHSKTQIEQQLARNLKAFPHIKGVNNHMGSKFTENRELMELVLMRLKDENLYFVDSLTSDSSYGSSLATEFGIKFAKRDVFLDDSKKGKNYMINQIENLIEIAEKNGVAIGICHTYKDSIDVLSSYLPKIKDRVEISSVTSIFNWL